MCPHGTPSPGRLLCVCLSVVTILVCTSSQVHLSNFATTTTNNHAVVRAQDIEPAWVRYERVCHILLLFLLQLFFKAPWSRAHCHSAWIPSTAPQCVSKVPHHKSTMAFLRLANGVWQKQTTSKQEVVGSKTSCKKTSSPDRKDTKSTRTRARLILDQKEST